MYKLFLGDSEMKKTALALALASLLFSAVPFDAHAAPGDKSTAQTRAPDVAEFDKQMAQAQENMKKMQAQMDQLQKTQNPKEREKLLQEHWNAMQTGMGMMNGMMGCMGGPSGSGTMGHGMMMDGDMMDGHMMGWGNMSSYYSNLTPEQVKQRQYMMDQYRNTQQQMMNHMMWHQNYMSQPSK
jgi:hypothetical protein